MSGSATTITVPVDEEQVAFVNVFTVDPGRQLELLQALDDATRDVFMTLPGFISANLHTSLDGQRVINYAQWASEKQFEESLQRADVREHMAKAADIATSWDPTLTRVRSVIGVAGGE